MRAAAGAMVSSRSSRDSLIFQLCQAEILGKHIDHVLLVLCGLSVSPRFMGVDQLHVQRVDALPIMVQKMRAGLLPYSELMPRETSAQLPNVSSVSSDTRWRSMVFAAYGKICSMEFFAVILN